MPAVSVLMAHHGEPTYIRQALLSLEAQTFRDFELVVVDDGANLDWADLTQGSSFAVQVLHNGMNLGLTRSLNLGLRRCAGRYVARLDSDDRMAPARLAAQLTYLDQHPGVGIVGSAVQMIDRNGRPARRSYPLTSPEDIRFALPVYNQLAHGSVMFRRELVAKLGGYDESCRYAQDYALWIRACEQGVEIANLPQPLYELRLHSGSISKAKQDEQAHVVHRIQRASSGRMSDALGQFFDSGRGRDQKRPYERYQRGKLALFALVASLNGQVPPSRRAQTWRFLLANGLHTIAVVHAEGSLQRSLRTKLEILVNSYRV